MILKVVKRRGKFRVVTADDRIAIGASGKSIDGGGFETRTKAIEIAQAVNLRLN